MRQTKPLRSVRAASIVHWLALCGLLAQSGCLEDEYYYYGESDGKGAIMANGTIFVVGESRNQKLSNAPGVDRYFDENQGGDDLLFEALTIDGSERQFESFFGGSWYDWVSGVVVDGEGNYLVYGETRSSDFPTSEGAHDSVVDGPGAAWVAKIDPVSWEIIFSTLVDGEAREHIRQVIPLPTGDYLLLGNTASYELTTDGSSMALGQRGGMDVFVAVLSGDGSSLKHILLVGGFHDDSAAQMALDLDGSVVVCGWTSSQDFPVTPGAFQVESDQSQVYCYGRDCSTYAGFVLKIGPELDSLAWSTLVAGGGYEELSDVAVDTEGWVWLLGTTGSPEFPVTEGALRGELGGARDAILLALSADGTNLAFATFLGGSDADYGGRMEWRDDHSLCTVGYTTSKDFPVTDDALQGRRRGSGAVFVAVFDVETLALDYATYLGGKRGRSWPTDVFVADERTVVVTGTTLSKAFPTTRGVVCRRHTGGQFDKSAFVSVLDLESSELVMSTFVGGRPHRKKVRF